MEHRDDQNMTPPAKALDMPQTRKTVKENALATESSRRPAIREQKGTFPSHLAPSGGWLNGLAQEGHSLGWFVLFIERLGQTPERVEQGRRLLSAQAPLHLKSFPVKRLGIGPLRLLAEQGGQISEDRDSFTGRGCLPL